MKKPALPTKGARGAGAEAEASAAKAGPTRGAIADDNSVADDAVGAHGMRLIGRAKFSSYSPAHMRALTVSLPRGLDVEHTLLVCMEEARRDVIVMSP